MVFCPHFCTEGLTVSIATLNSIEREDTNLNYKALGYSGELLNSRIYPDCVGEKMSRVPGVAGLARLG
jgi:hypothetical protein